MKDGCFIKKFLNKTFLYDFLMALAAFAIPLIALIILFTINNFALVDHKGSTIIMFDMQSEYISFLRNLRYSLINHESLVYTTKRTFGGEYLSIFSFYLASPFNLLTPLIKESDLPLFFVWSNIIKMSLASLNMYLLLRLSTKNKNIAYIGFAFAYGLISYSFAEMHNFMWLDCVMILPLVILGVKYLEEGKKHWVYALTLAYALGTSWYIGALICMFLVIFFVYRIICLNTKQERLAFTIRFGVTSIAGGFITAALWFTAFMHLVGTKATGGLPNDARFFSLSMFFTGFLTNNFESANVLTLYSGWTTMFTSVITLVIGQLFFLNRGYSKKERYGALGVLILYFFIVSSNQLSALFHGGQEPTWFPTRFSFVIGFFVVYLAGLQINKINETKELDLIVPVVSLVVVLLIVLCIPNDKLAGKTNTLYKISYLGLALYIVTLLAVFGYVFLRNKKHLESKWLYIGLCSLIAVLTGISSSEGANKMLHVYQKDHEGQSYETYLADNLYADGVNKIKALETTDNYRMEITSNRPGNYNEINNNPLFFSYNGLSHFSSNSKLVVKSYFEKLGYQNNYFFEKFDGGGTLSVSSLLGLKYLIDENNSSTNKPIYQKHAPFDQLTELHSDDKDLLFYKNNYALPLGFAVNQTSDHYISEGEIPTGQTEVYWYDHFEYQNQIFKTFVSDVLDSSNNKKNIFEKLEVLETTIGHGLTYTTSLYGDKYFTGLGSITYKVAIPAGTEDNNFYFYAKDVDNNDRIRYYLDGRYYECNSYWHRGMRGLPYTTRGYVTLRVDITKQINNERIMPEFYMENVSVLGEYIEKIKSQASYDMKSIKKTWSYGLEGTFNLTKENQIFLFTLPYEKDFTITVDGKRMNTITRWNVFTAVDLTGFTLGNHKIKLTYTDKSFIMGLIITNIGIGGLVGIMLFEKRLSNKKQKDLEND